MLCAGSMACSDGTLRAFNLTGVLVPEYPSEHRLMRICATRRLVLRSVSSASFHPLREFGPGSVTHQLESVTDRGPLSSVLVYSIPDGGPSAMVWGVCCPHNEENRALSLTSLDSG